MFIEFISTTNTFIKTFNNEVGKFNFLLFFSSRATQKLHTLQKNVI